VLIKKGGEQDYRRAYCFSEWYKTKQLIR